MKYEKPEVRLIGDALPTIQHLVSKTTREAIDSSGYCTANAYEADE
jgi:hypothetical protein